MKVFAAPDVGLGLPEGHRFPADKYQLLYDLLLSDGILCSNELLRPRAATREELLLAHDAIYIDALTDGAIDQTAMRRLGFPWSDKVAVRGALTVGGSIAAAEAALREGIAGQLAGGTHHAHRDFGSGFCIYNDLAVVARKLIRDGRVDRVAIIDCDVHQGDGNAAILRDDPDVYILDLFCEKNFPFRKVPSRHDVPLPVGADDQEYLETLKLHLPDVLDFGPDIVLYQMGVDGLASDHLGKLNLTFDGLMMRDRMIFSAFAAKGIPVSLALGGGYARPISDTVRAYANTYRVAKEIYPNRSIR